jgi:hydrogenase maturation protease
MNTVIVGLGNPILSDDSVGIQAARLVAKRLNDMPNAIRDSVTVAEVYAGGLRLMDALIGYDEAVVIDSIQTGQCQPGAIFCFDMPEMAKTQNLSSTHDTGIDVALQMGAMLGLRIPEIITVWAIEAADVATYGETLTASVADSLPVVVEHIIAQITRSN